MSKVRGILSKQQEGPIVYVTKSHAPSTWTKFSLLQEQDRLKHLKSMFQGEPQQEEAEWSWWKLFNTIFGMEDNKMNDKAPDSYNIYKRSPDFRNNYGWSIALDGSDYGPLEDSGIGIYLVNLTAVINLKVSTLHIAVDNFSLIRLSHTCYNNFELYLY